MRQNRSARAARLSSKLLRARAARPAPLVGGAVAELLTDRRVEIEHVTSIAVTAKPNVSDQASSCGQSESNAAHQFTASLSALPGLNLGTFCALILTAAPVRGLRPVRAERIPIWKLPKPFSATTSPLRSLLLITASVASSARVAWALGMSPCLAMC